MPDFRDHLKTPCLLDAWSAQEAAHGTGQWAVHESKPTLPVGEKIRKVKIRKGGHIEGPEQLMVIMHYSHGQPVQLCLNVPGRNGYSKALSS